MHDHSNREIKHVRFSITSKCNYRCIFCDREGFIPKTKELSVEEIRILCKLLAEILEVTRIKLTGGEPLCRDEVVRIVKNISDLHLYEDISLTTNGSRLYNMARALKDAGLHRINVSLCSLNPETYKRIYGQDCLNRILSGLQRAKDVGLYPIKLNYVVLKGVNDTELENIIDFCGQNGYILQLIELHELSPAVGDKNGLYERYHLDLSPIIKNLQKRAVKTITREHMQNRKIFTLPNSAVIETIIPSHEFCMGCTKLRIGCDGNLFGCLYRADLGQNLSVALQHHYSIEQYEQMVRQVVDLRDPYFKIEN